MLFTLKKKKKVFSNRQPKTKAKTEPQNIHIRKLIIQFNSSETSRQTNRKWSLNLVVRWPSSKLEIIQGRSPTEAFWIEVDNIVPHCGFPVLRRIAFRQQLLDRSVHFICWCKTSTEEARNRYSGTYAVRHYLMLNTFQSVICYKLKKQK